MKFFLAVIVLMNMSFAFADDSQPKLGPNASPDLTGIPTGGCVDNDGDGKCDTTGREMPRKDAFQGQERAKAKSKKAISE